MNAYLLCQQINNKTILKYIITFPLLYNMLQKNKYWNFLNYYQKPFQRRKPRMKLKLKMRTIQIYYIYQLIVMMLNGYI